MTERQVEVIVEKLREAESLVLSAMEREPKNYVLNDCKSAIWKAMHKAAEATNE